jgi:hypothetical protein
VLQVSQIAVPFEIQAAPVAAIPPEQVQVLAWQATPLRDQPVLQVSQIAVPFEIQAAPVAAIPPEQVQVLALHATPLRVQPALQLAHIAVPSEIQAAPVAAIPPEQVQVLAWQQVKVMSSMAMSDFPVVPRNLNLTTACGIDTLACTQGLLYPNLPISCEVHNVVKVPVKLSA